MGIKSELKSKAVLDFPKLMTDTKIVVLFEGFGAGFVVKGEDYFEIGKYSKSWDMDKFFDFDGSVTLSNEA